MGQDDGTDVTPIDITSTLTPPTDVLGTLPGGGVIQPTPVSPSSPSTFGTDLSSIVNALTKGAQSGVQIYNASQSPGLIPGTQAIFNPATGQYFVPTTGQVVNPFMQGTSGAAAVGLMSSPFLLIGGLVLGGLVLVSMLGGKR